MQEKLIEYLDEIVQALKQGIDFSTEQAPLFIQEVLHYYAYYHWIWAIVLVVVTLFMWAYAYGCYMKYLGQSWFENWEFGVGLTLVLSIAPLIGACIHTLQIIKLNVAPRLYLIEEISKLF